MLVVEVYPLKKITVEFVNWDDYPQYMEEYNMFQTTKQTTSDVKNASLSSVKDMNLAANMALGQNLVALVSIKIDGKWMFIHPNMEP